MGLEIERKWLPNGNAYRKKIEGAPFTEIEQRYLCTDPVIRVRNDGGSYYLTYKGKGHLEREEYNLPLTGEAYEKLSQKCDGRVIKKNRYRLPLSDGLTLEIDEFLGELSPLVIFEIEFSSRAEAESYQAPQFFGKEVTEDTRYTNAYLSSTGIDVDTIMC